MNPLVIIFAMLSLQVMGQNFSNADLEGQTGMSATPPGWYAVSHSDAVCLAYSNLAATPDVTSQQGPIPAIGVAGTAHSGNTFVSGLISGTPGQHHQEGIKQTVNGLIPGKHYNVTFYQAVVKQNNALDGSGSWAVYIDSQLAGISSPSQSNLSYDHHGLEWEERSVHFEATNASHSIKFLPMDDDNSQTVPNESLRMGIDHIALDDYHTHVFHDTICAGDTATVWATGASDYHWVNLNDTAFVLSNDSILHSNPDSTTHFLVYNDVDTNLATVTVLHPPSLSLGPDHHICPGDSTLINPVVSHAESHLWSDGSNGFDMMAHDSGLYWLSADNTCGSALDSIYVIYDSLELSEFGFDSTACSHEGLTLDASYQNADYYWSDGSTTSSLFVEHPGEYWVEISNHCGWIRDTFNIEMHACGSLIEMPNVFSPNNDGVNDLYQPITQEFVAEYHLVILNRWGNVVFESYDLSNTWNGKSSGDDVSEGVYFWQIEYSDYSGGNFNEQGSLTLLR